MDVTRRCSTRNATRAALSTIAGTVASVDSYSNSSANARVSDKTTSVTAAVVTAAATNRKKRKKDEIDESLNTKSICITSSSSNNNDNDNNDSNDNDNKDSNNKSKSSSVGSSSGNPYRHSQLSHIFYSKVKNTDPSLCLHQIDSMYQIYYQNEMQFTPRQFKQADINFKIRAILIDWLVEVHNKFKMQCATLWLCVNIIDRYLEKKEILRNKLQLVGVTALLIACKFEEIHPPEIIDCIYITDHAYTREDLLQMEVDILTSLNFNIFIPTGYHFLVRYLDIIKASACVRHIASYYCERNLQESDLLLFKPHVFAAAGVYCALLQQYQQLSRLSSDACIWSDVLVQETGLTEPDLRACAKSLLKHVSEEPLTASKRLLTSAKKKYRSDRLLSVSTLPLPML